MSSLIKSIIIAVPFGLFLMSCNKEEVELKAANPRSKPTERTSNVPPDATSQQVGRSGSLIQKYKEGISEDAEKTLREIDSDIAPAERDAFFASLLEEIGDLNPKAILAILSRFSSTKARNQALTRFAFSFAGKNPAALFDFATKEMTGRDKNVAMYASVQGMLSRGDVAKAKTAIESMPLSAERLNGIGLIASSMASTNVNDAIDWAKSLKSVEDRERAFSDLVPSVSEFQGLSGLDTLLKESHDPGVRSLAIKRGVEIASKQNGIQGAVEWIGKLPPGSQGFAASLLIESSAVEDSSSWDTLFSAIKNDGEQQQAVSAVAYKLSQKNPLNAAQWALTVPSNLRHAALGSLVVSWYDIDSTQMSDWMSALPKGADRDFVLGRVAIHIAQSDKETASQLANQIADPAVKKSTLNFLK